MKSGCSHKFAIRYAMLSDSLINTQNIVVIDGRFDCKYKIYFSSELENLLFRSVFTPMSCPSVVPASINHTTNYIFDRSIITTTHLPQTISKVVANMLCPMSKLCLDCNSFCSNLLHNFLVFSLKIGTNEFRMRLLNVMLIALRSFFHMCARKYIEVLRMNPIVLLI